MKRPTGATVGNMDKLAHLWELAQQPSPEQPYPPELAGPVEFIGLLYRGNISPTGFVEFRILGEGKSVKKWMPWPVFPGHPDVKTLDDLREWQSAGDNAFFGVSLRETNTLSGDEHVHPTHLLWADLDMKGTAYLPEGADVLTLTPAVLREAVSRLHADLMARCVDLGLPPRAVVYSGHGLQVYWARTSRSTKDETVQMNTVLYEVFRDLGADSKVKNVERILRPPGSLNLKNPDRPLQVEVWHIDAEARIERDDISALAPQPVPVMQLMKPPRPAARKPSSTVTNDSAKARAEKRRRAEVAAAVRGEEENVRAAPDGERNNTLNIAAVKLARFLPHGELEESQLVEVLTAAARAAGLAEDEIMPTLRSGIAKGTQDPADPERFEAEERQKVGRKPGTNEGQEEEPWPARAALPARLPEAPTMPPEMVPERLRPWLVDLTELNCIPLEYMAAPAIAGLSGLIGRSMAIRPERFTDWAVTPNLWGGIVGGPGAMKSHAVQEALAPLTRLEVRAAQEHEEAQQAAEIEAELLQAERAQLKGKKGAGMTREALQDLKQRELENTVTARRYVLQNVTVEKLGELLRENPRGLTVVRDELASWIYDHAREERAEALGFYLAAWNGDGAYTFDRIGRGTVRIPQVCVSVVGGIQPGPLSAFIADSRSGSRGDQGLLQRFQLLVYPDSLGNWERPTRRASQDAKNAAFEIYEALDGLYDPDRESPPVLAFDAEAQDIWNAWRDELEGRLRGHEFEGAPGFESHLSKYRSLVPSLAAVFHLVQVAAPGMSADALGNIPAEPLELALNWAAFLEAHARKVYAYELGLSMIGAYALADKIKAGSVKDGDSTRDLRRKDWAELSGARFDAALEQLQALGWVRAEDVPTEGAPREVLRLHPELRKGQA